MNNLACPTDEELIPLLAGETAEGSIDAHLRDCPTCRRRLDVFRSDLDALRSLSLPSAGAAAAPPPPPRPARIGRYLVVGSLDSGGQADVYRAVHPTLETELVIKLSRKAVGRLSDHRPLLVAEGKLLTRLDHPGLAKILDLDFHDDQPFLAMEYVRGPNLRKYAVESPVPPRRAAELVAGVARALDEVHRHGVVHQDVKPQNILIDEHGRPRLIDFGMARLRHAWDDDGPKGGTPEYMAPEQARQDEPAIGPRADIFALGAVLYFLLTGKPPYQGVTRLESLALAQRCEFDRAALDRQSIPRRLRDICLKAMAANPAERFARADEFAEALERFLTLPKRVGRAAGLAAAAVLLVALVAAAVKGMWGPRETAAPISPLPQPQKTEQLDTEIRRVLDDIGKQRQAAEAKAPDVQLKVTRSRGAKPVDLMAAMPLDPLRDRVQVLARVSRGHHAKLFHVNCKGEITELVPRRRDHADHSTLTYPRDDGELVTFEPESGTELVLLVASDNATALAVVTADSRHWAVLKTAGRDDKGNWIDVPLPVLPPTVEPVRFLGDEVGLHSRDFGDRAKDPRLELKRKLERLWDEFGGDNLSVFCVVAYGHGPRVNTFGW